MDKNDFSSRIIHFDKDFCVVTKFAGENSQSEIPELFADEIKNRCRERGDKINIKIIECPHRLDMCVSGVQIICFSEESLKFFSNQFAQNNVKKTYFAIVESKEFPQEGTLKNYITFNTDKKKAYLYDYEKRKSKVAILDYFVFGSGVNYSYLEVHPKTGRTHQIRCQLANEGMHIKGDVKYGARRSDSLPGIRLFAYSVQVGQNIYSSDFPEKDNLWSDFMEKWVDFNKIG